MAAPVDTGRWPDHVSGEWTTDALETLPDNGLRYEILDGTLLVTPASTPLHQTAVLELAVLLRNACPPDLQVFVAPLDWQPDGRTSLEPDLLVVRRDRIGEKKIILAPTVVVEVLTPGTARIDRLLKMSRCAEGGIEQYWIVDPRVPAVQVFTLVDGAYVLLTEGAGETAVSVLGPLAAGRAGRVTPPGQRRAEALWATFWRATRAVELTDAVTAHAGELAASAA